MSERPQRVPMFSEAALELASENYDSQERLVEALQQAFAMSKMSVADLAYELEMSTDDAQSWIDGEIDLRLSQLRHLANAIDAKVSYRVHALRTRYEGRVEALARGFDWENARSWQADRARSPRELLVGANR